MTESTSPWHTAGPTAPLDYVAEEPPERASRGAYVAGLIGAFILGLLFGALLVSA